MSPCKLTLISLGLSGSGMDAATTAVSGRPLELETRTSFIYERTQPNRLWLGKIKFERKQWFEHNCTPYCGTRVVP